MRNPALALCLGYVALGCTAPSKAPSLGCDDLAGISNEIVETRATLRRLEAQLDLLETRISGTGPRDEFTSLTIDATADPATVPGITGLDRSNAVLCHVVEWRGFEKMKRFTQLADPQFDLVAEGHPTLVGNTGVGGICNPDGSSRFVILRTSGRIEPSVRYTLRPRNQNKRYKWTVADGAFVVAQ